MASQDFTINQGETFSLPFYWYAGDPVIKAITAIAAGYPPLLTAASHGLPTGKIPVELVTIEGPTELNTEGCGPVYALKVDGDTFSLPDINAGTLSAAYAGGGYLVYRAPKDLTDYTARMQIRRAVNSSSSILELSSEHETLVLGGVEGSIVAALTDEVTAELDFVTAVYQLELTSPAGEVKRLAGGTVRLNREVTR